MKRASLFILLAFLFLFPFAIYSLALGNTTLVYDDFNDNIINDSIWIIDVAGENNQVQETDGVMEFTTFGHHGWQYGHAVLNTTPVMLPSWSKIIVQGDWRFYESHNPNTADMTMKLYDCNDPSKFVFVRYVSWLGDKLNIKWSSEGETFHTDIPRSIPRDHFAHYKLIVTKEGFEFWENGQKLYNHSTPDFSLSSCIVYSFGGWDYSSYYSHMYYDNINITFEPLGAGDETPPSAVTNLRHYLTPDMIEWVWTNPAEPDFKDVLVYINGSFVGTTSEENWVLENPQPGAVYTIGLLTEDQSGNINYTWVNDTARALVPSNIVYVNTSGWWYPDQEFVLSESPLNDAVKAVLPEGTIYILSGVYGESIPIFKPLTIVDMGGVLRGDGTQFDPNLPETPVIFVDPGEGNVTLIGLQINATVSNTGVMVESGSLKISNSTIDILGEEGLYKGVVAIGSETMIDSLNLNITAPNTIGVLFNEAPAGTMINNSYIRIHGDGSIGIYSYSSSAGIFNNTIHVSGLSSKIGANIEISDSPLSELANNTLLSNSTNPSSYDLIVSGDGLWKSGLNIYNDSLIGIECMGNCMLKSSILPPETSLPGNKIYVGPTLYVSPDTWIVLKVYYNESTLQGVTESSLELWELSNGWSQSDIVNQTLNADENFISANITGEALYAILGSQQANAPVINFVSPTPSNNTVTENPVLSVNVTSDIPLQQALLIVNETIYNMEGEGNRWQYNLSLSEDGVYIYYVRGVSQEGLSGVTETRLISLDTSPPMLLYMTANATEAFVGDIIKLSSLWLDPHLSLISLWGNVTGSNEMHLITQGEAEEKMEWFNITVETTNDSPGSYCWYTVAYDQLGHQTRSQTKCFTLQEPLMLTSYEPQNNTPAMWDNSTLNFSIELNMQANITWFINSTRIKNEANTQESFLMVSNPQPGHLNITVVASRNGQSVGHEWDVKILTDTIPPTLTFVQPTPANGSYINWGSLKIRVISSENAENATLYYDGQPISLNGTGRIWEINVNAGNEGKHSFYFTAYDEHGNLGRTGTIIFTLDKTNPTIHLEPHNLTTIYGKEGAYLYAERTFQASIDITLHDDNPDVFTVKLTKKTLGGHTNPNYFMEQYIFLNKEYNDGSTYTVRLDTRKEANFTIEITVFDKAGNKLVQHIPLTIKDTLPPGPPSNVTVRPSPFQATLVWASPSDADYQYTIVYLDPPLTEKIVINKGEKEVTRHWVLENATIYTVYSKPDSLNQLSLNLTAGPHTVFLQSVDKYGNRGEAIKKNFDVPLPPLIISFAPPTPNNNTVKQPKDTTFDLYVNSTIDLKEATLILNNISYPMNVENKTAYLRKIVLVPGLPYNYQVKVKDIYDRENSTETRAIFVLPQNFADGSMIKISYNGEPTLSLYFHPTIMLYSNTMPEKMYLKATLQDFLIEYPLNITVTNVSKTTVKPELKENFGSMKEPRVKVYNITLKATVNLWKMQKLADDILSNNKPLVVHLEITAMDPSGNKIEDSKDYVICNNPDLITFNATVKKEYHERENTTLTLITPDGIRSAGFYIRVNGGEYRPITNESIITHYLAKGENTINILMNSTCGKLVLRTYKTFMGPPLNGDWIINTTVKADNRMIEVNGNVIITENSSLRIIGSTLIAKGASIGVNGELKTTGSTIQLSGTLNSTLSKLIINRSNLTFLASDLRDSHILFEKSRIIGHIKVNGTNTTIIQSVVDGDAAISGDATIKDTLIYNGRGLSLENSYDSSLQLQNLTLKNTQEGLIISNYYPLLGSSITNVTVEGALTGLTLSYTQSYNPKPSIKISGLLLKDNHKGMKTTGYNAVIERAHIIDNDVYAIKIMGTGGRSYFILKGSEVKGKPAINAKNVGSLIINNTNIEGDVLTENTTTNVIVSENNTVWLSHGSLSDADLEIQGTLIVRSFIIEHSNILITGNLKVMDTDGIPATIPVDRDPSIIKDTSIIQQSIAYRNSSITILNSVLENSPLSADTRWLLIRGSKITNGKVTLNSKVSGESVHEYSLSMISVDSPWYYIKSSPDIATRKWLHTNDTTGMSIAKTPILGYRGLKSASWGKNGSVIGKYTDLYLKKTVFSPYLPLEAPLTIHYTGSIEVYINGVRVYGRTGGVALTTDGHGHIIPVLREAVIDISSYMVPGENVIVVHQKLPKNTPFNLMGVFKASLSLKAGYAGITDSLIESNINGYSTRALFKNDTINGNMSFSYFSEITVRESTIEGHINILGKIVMEKTLLQGRGKGTGINTLPQYAWVRIDGSVIRGYYVGLKANNNVTIRDSELSGNRIGAYIINAGVDIQDNYIINNYETGMVLINTHGRVHNNIFSNNTLGLNSTLSYSSGTPSDMSTYIDHNTIIGNGIGVAFHSEGPVSGETSFTYNIVQGNNMGVYINASLTPTLNYNAIQGNRKGTLIEGKNSPFFRNTDWGHQIKRVSNYTGGIMYTSNGKYSPDTYDVLDKTWKFIFSYHTASKDWGSNLLSAYMTVYPMENGSLRGEVMLYGKAYSRNGLSLIQYSLDYRGQHETIYTQQIDSDSYNSYIPFDTLGHNLTGKGTLEFTVVDRTGRRLTYLRNVYFGNSEIRITNLHVRNPTSIYVLRRSPSYYNGSIPYDERFANITMNLKNTGMINARATIEIKLPSYIERHTGRIKMVVGLPGNQSGILYVAFPITVFNPLTLTWDPQPDELPLNKIIPVKINVYDKDGILRQTINTNITFKLGPVFKITKYDAVVYSKQYCEGGGSCHQKNIGGSTIYTYDGDGDGILEAAESHHFNIYIENVGDEPAYLRELLVLDHIIGKKNSTIPGVKSIDSNGAAIEFPPNMKSMYLIDSYNTFLPVIVDPGETIKINGGWMPWWADSPPKFIPPVNYTGDYLTNAQIYYDRLKDGMRLDGYMETATINYERTPVQALQKEFQKFTKMIGPIKVSVLGVNGEYTIMSLENTNDNVYYSYYAEGSYDTNRKGYLWYHVIPPGFEFTVSVPHSRMPRAIIPHYRVDVGFETSLLFNEIELGAIGLQGALGVMDIDVPAQTIISALVKAFLKITNIVENLNIPSNATSIEDLQNSPEASQYNRMLMNNEETIVPLNLDILARWEKNYGIGPQFFRDMENFENLPVSKEASMVINFAKAIVTDDDLQVLFLETLLEVLDNDLANDIYKMINDIRNQPSPQEELGESLDAFNEQIRKEMVQIIKEEVKKQKSFQSLSAEEQEKTLKEVGEESAAALEAFEQMGEWAFYNIYAMLTQPLPQTITVLDPPGNYTVEAEKADTAIIMGGEPGSSDGWGNITLVLGKPDEYTAHYIVPTKTTRIGNLMGKMIWKMNIMIEGKRTAKGQMDGNITITMTPSPQNATMLRTIFREKTFARVFLSTYLQNITESTTKFRGDTITISGRGIVSSVPADQTVSINITADPNLTIANVKRTGNYTGSMYIRPSLGIKSSNVNVTIKGERAQSPINTSMGEFITITENKTIAEPNIKVYPLNPVKGSKIKITTDRACHILWKLDGESGEGYFVPTENVPLGNHTLVVKCLYANKTIEKAYEILVLSPRKQNTRASGENIRVSSGSWERIQTKTDLYRIYFKAKSNITGKIAVYQMPGRNLTYKEYRYVLYSLFNITHPISWEMENITIRFRLPLSWINKNNITSNDILVLRLTGGPLEIKPILETMGTEYAYYKARVPTLSVYAVGYKMNIPQKQETTTQTTTTASVTPTTTHSSTIANTTTQASSTASATSGEMIKEEKTWNIEIAGVLTAVIIIGLYYMLSRKRTQ